MKSLPKIALSALLLLATACASTPREPVEIDMGPPFTLEQWTHLDGRAPEWTQIGEDGFEVKPGTGNLITKMFFREGRIELDFMTPHMPDAQGQARGNSGVYIHGLYEVQILDSFGVVPGLDTCGAIYNVAPASEQVCLEPGVWQHYAIEFIAPRFDDAGGVISNPTMSVWQNGTQIHDNVELPGPTGSANGAEMLPMGGIMLQDHGNKVRFRNVRYTGF
ncbi:MAG: hypothetical protein ACI9D0_001858 [Bacteroidia bacterium]|jgi:hypothetical protein